MLTARRIRVPARSCLLAGQKAAVRFDSSARPTKGGGMIGDRRIQQMQEFLYTPIQPTTPPQENDPAVQQQHDETEIIERMWALEKLEEARSDMEALKRKYRAMRFAMLELEKLDERLFAGAISGGLADDGDTSYVTFPRNLRIPTETPPLSGFNPPADSS
ncbi:hypothetical protein BJ742DRAFT_812144 [Cladochytrium replicatum]|nr:hypothetical protein BJ742DRAFT_812144 [Cladochytrium replicatum]